MWQCYSSTMSITDIIDLFSHMLGAHCHMLTDLQALLIGKAAQAGTVADAAVAVAGGRWQAAALRLPGQHRVRAAVQLSGQRQILCSGLQYHWHCFHNVPHL